MTSKLSSTAVSSHSSTPASFLLTDDYLAADLSDLDELDTLPTLTLVEQQQQHGQANSRQEEGGAEEEGEEDEVDEDGVVKLVVDDETRAQLREIQGALSTQLAGKPYSTHLSTATQHGLSTAITSSATSSHVASTTASSSATSVSSLLSLLASKEADLRLAAQLGEALSDKTETLEQYCRHLEQQLAASSKTNTAYHHHPTPTPATTATTAQQHEHHHHHNPSHHKDTHKRSQPASPTHRTSHSLSSIANGSTAEEELSRLRLELGRLERRMAVSESWHRDALKLARKERHESEERVQELEREGKRREAEEVERRKREEEERLRLTEEVEQLHAMEQQRLVRERELRRQREQKEKEAEDEQRQTRQAAEQAEHRWRDEQRRREELERRCRTLEKQRDDALHITTQQTKEFEHRRRRWEEERSRAVDDEVERHRTQAKALAEQYRAVEERMKQHGKVRTLSVDTSGRLSPSPTSPPLSGDEGRERRAVLVSHSTQTPGEWMQLDRAESAMTIPKGRGETESVLYSPLQFTLLSPSTTDGAPRKAHNEEVKEASTLVGSTGLSEEELVIPLSLITPPRQATRSPYLSPHSPFPSGIELTEADERALIDIATSSIPSGPTAITATDREDEPNKAGMSNVSFLSPLYAQQVGPSSSSNARAPSSAPSNMPTATALSPAPANPVRRTVGTPALSSFLQSPLFTRPFFRSPQPTPPPPPPPPAPSASTSSTASSPLLFTLHTSQPSSIRAHLMAASAPLPPLQPLSSPFLQLQSSLVKQADGSSGTDGKIGKGAGRLQVCTDDDTKRVFSVLMQTRMGEGAAGFS